MSPHYDLAHLPADQLLAALHRLLACDHQVTADLLAHLAEVEARRLYLDHACASMFTYCVERLHLAEPTAYKRIEAARAARRFPAIFGMVAAGELHLTAVTLLAPHLTAENHRDLLTAAVHRSKREVQRLLAVRFPQPAVPTDLRKLPQRPAAASSPTPPLPSPPALPPAVSAAPAAAIPAAPPLAVPAPPAPPLPLTLTPPAPARAEVRPLAPDRYALKLTISAAVHDKLLVAQALLRHRLPSGDLNAVLDRALDALLADLRRDKFGATAAPRPPKPQPPAGRRLPNPDRRAVLARDGEQCSFVDASGHRCQERGWLELDHVQPFAKGGASDSQNSRVLCRAHNQHAAAQEYGAEWLARRVAAARAAP